MTDDAQHAPRAGRSHLDYVSLEQRVTALEAAQKIADGTVAQLTAVLTPLVVSVQAMEVDQKQFNEWFKLEREQDAKAAEKERSEADFRRGQEAYKAAIKAKRERRMRWLRPLLQGMAGILALILAVFVDSLREPIGEYVKEHVGWGAGALGVAAILVSIILLILAIRAA